MDNISLIGTIGTLIFGLLSVYLFFKSRRTKSILFISRNYVLQTKNHPSLRLSFGDTEISNLSKATVLFFNNGTDAIKKPDVPKLMVVLDKSVRLLSANLTVVSSPDNKIAITTYDNRIPLDLEFLNPQDGGAMELLYESQKDAASSENTPELSFEGTIIGGRISTRPYDKTFRPTDERYFVPYIVFLCVGLINTGIFISTYSSSKPEMLAVFIACGPAVALLCLLLGFYWFMRRRTLGLPQWLPSDFR